MATYTYAKLGAAALSLTIGFVSQIRSAPDEPRFDHQVRSAFFAGFGGDAASLAKAMKVCEDVLAGNPKHAEALVWHGAGLFYQSGQLFRAGQREKGMELYEKGLREMDEAVSLEPDRIGVRIPRGAVLLTASRAMAQNPMRASLLERGLQDYGRALEIQRPILDKMGEHPKGELLFGLAEGWSRSGDAAKAQTFFDMIISELPGTPYAERAKLWLANRSLPMEKTGCIGCHVGK